MTKPLVAPHILVARPLGQSGPLLDLLRAAGFTAQHFPVMEIAPIPEAIPALTAQVAVADWLVLVSPSAIDVAWPHLAKLPLVGKKWLCVGAASAQRLSQLSGHSVLYPTQGSDSEALLALPELAELAGQNVLIIRGEGGRALLAQTLSQRGALVQFAQLYRRVDGKPDWTMLDQPPAAAMIVSSGEMAEQLFRLASPQRTRALQCLLYCVPHPRIANKLRALGAEHIVTTQANDAALVTGLKQWFCRHL